MAIPETIEAKVALLLLDAVTDHCVNDVSSSDASRADWVILGKPTSERSDPIVISIHMQHPLGMNIGKEKASASRPTQMDPWQVLPETQGGMMSRVQVGAVQIDIREDVPFSEAIHINAAVARRVKQAIDNDISLAGPITDDFGDLMSWIQTFEAAGYVAGGGDVSIHARWVNFKMLVHSSNVRS